MIVLNEITKDLRCRRRRRSILSEHSTGRREIPRAKRGYLLLVARSTFRPFDFSRSEIRNRRSLARSPRDLPHLSAII